MQPEKSGYPSHILPLVFEGKCVMSILRSFIILQQFYCEQIN